MNRKVLALTCAIGLSASMLTACGGQDNDAGTTRTNNVNGYSQQYRNNGMMNNNGTGTGTGMGTGLRGGSTFGNGFGDEGTEETRGVGSNGVGVSGTANGPGATNGGMAGGNR